MGNKLYVFFSKYKKVFIAMCLVYYFCFLAYTLILIAFFPPQTRYPALSDYSVIPGIGDIFNVLIFIFAVIVALNNFFLFIHLKVDKKVQVIFILQVTFVLGILVFKQDQNGTFWGPIIHVAFGYALLLSFLVNLLLLAKDVTRSKEKRKFIRLGVLTIYIAAISLILLTQNYLLPEIMIVVITLMYYAYMSKTILHKKVREVFGIISSN